MDEYLFLSEVLWRYL